MSAMTEACPDLVRHLRELLFATELLGLTLPVLWAIYSIDLYSVETDFRRQILTSKVDPRTEKSNIYNDRRNRNMRFNATGI